MSLNDNVEQAEELQSGPGVVDISLTRPPDPTLSVSVDQMMSAVEGVRRYVVSHLAHIGRACDVDDVLQDIRVAVWDGVARGHYRQLPGVPFEAWVQGVTSNICAAHARRELTHKTLPLLLDPTGDEVSGSWGQLSAILIAQDNPETQKIIDQEWAVMVLQLTREAVSAPTWRMAVESLTAPRQYALPTQHDRRRWNAVTAVRQTAKTISMALDVAPGSINDIGQLCQRAVECLPSALLRAVAKAIVLPEIHGPERQAAIARLARELGVSDRYVAVQIGTARRLYQTAWRVVRTAASF
ncbi:sigma factor [Paenarthrobacter sp. AB444]|uniref:sigma factor n=1 Tax=Paenarthrobacter sp. AB444 TaxID=3025681 RepID=UPI002365EEB2|nr:sigma factor [Paenarthrobacter sp. AB444]MDD7833930.1 sigma factor [Paenarthrobacter sp. AB444]